MSANRVCANLDSIPTFESGADWNIHRENLENFFNSKCIVDDKRKISVMISSIHHTVYSKLQDLCDPVLPFFKTYDELCEIIKEHFSQKDRQQFSSLKQLKRFYSLQQSSE